MTEAITIPGHPGAKLEYALKKLNPPLSQSELARRTGISFQRINGIICGRRSLTIDSALRIERVTGIAAVDLLEAQIAFDLHKERKALAGSLKKIKPWENGASVKA